MDFDPDKMTDFLKLWTPLNPRSYRARVLAYLAHARATKQKASPEVLREYLDERSASGMSASTVRGEFFAVKKFLLGYYDYEASSGAVDEVGRYSVLLVLGSIKPPSAAIGRRVQRLSGWTMERLDRVIVQATPRTGAMIEFLFNTGVRLDEMLSLRLKRIDPVDKKFSQITVLGKGRKERCIPVLTSLIVRIKRLFKGTTFLFESSKGNALRPQNVRKYITDAFRRYDGIPLSPHNMRHLHSIMMLNTGQPLGRLSRSLGHSSVTTTAQIYDTGGLPNGAFAIKHHGARGSKGGNSNGRKPKNVQTSEVSSIR